MAEEDRLADWLVERSKRGIGLSVSEFLDKSSLKRTKEKLHFKGTAPAENGIEGSLRETRKSD